MNILKSAGGIIAFIAIIMVMTLGGWAWKYYTAPIKGTVDAEVQIESAESRIQNYEKFFDMCAVAQTRQSALTTQQAMLESAEDKKERSRIRANIAGMDAQLDRAVNQYNVNVQKTYTQARFKSESLPYRLNADQPINCQ